MWQCEYRECFKLIINKHWLVVKTGCFLLEFRVIRDSDITNSCIVLICSQNLHWFLSFLNAFQACNVQLSNCVFSLWLWISTYLAGILLSFIWTIGGQSFKTEFECVKFYITLISIWLIFFLSNFMLKMMHQDYFFCTFEIQTEGSFLCFPNFWQYFCHLNKKIII